MNLDPVCNPVCERTTINIGLGAGQAPGMPLEVCTDLAADNHRFGHFTLLEEIGQGGFGKVYRAFDERLQRIVAIKAMLLTHVEGESARLMSEARAAASVRHENVVQIHAVEEGCQPYIVMEHVAGGSLNKRLVERGSLPLTEALRVAMHVARGLAAAHGQGFVHRDIKPGNILLESLEEGLHARLTDFGLARSSNEIRFHDQGCISGTPAYMSPEQARGECLTNRSDLYSLGSVLYEMVSCRLPFDGSPREQLLDAVASGKARPLREVSPDAPHWLCEIMNRLHAPFPQDRFATALELAEELDRQLTALAHPALKPIHSSRNKWAFAVALLLSLVSGLALNSFRTTNHSTDGVNREDSKRTDRSGPAVVHSNALGMTFARVPRGTIRLGGIASLRSMTVPADFYMGTHEVTRAEYERVLGAGACPGRIPTGTPAEAADRLPVTGVSWNDSQEFLRTLNRQVAEPGWTYRLPQAGEWEYACRGGEATEPGMDYFTGEPSSKPDTARMNCRDSGLGRPVPVGSYPANVLGLYDMHGNAFELLDSANGDIRWLAGGCWTDEAAKTRAGVFFGVNRSHRMAGGGFRVVRVPASDAPEAVAGANDPNVEAVVGVIRKANPRFHGNVHVRMQDGYVSGISIADSVGLTDLTGLETFRNLKQLCIPGSDITSLTPLKNMSLEQLNLWGFAGQDLEPLRGMPLKELNCGGGGQLLNLQPLEGMKLEVLGLNHTKTDDLSALAKLPLRQLMIGSTCVSDLMPLAGMQSLRSLHLDGSPVLDLSPVAGLELEVLDLDFVEKQHEAVLRQLTKLKTINRKPVDEFWNSLSLRSASK